VCHTDISSNEGPPHKKQKVASDNRHSASPAVAATPAGMYVFAHVRVCVCCMLLFVCMSVYTGGAMNK